MLEGWKTTGRVLVEDKGLSEVEVEEEERRRPGDLRGSRSMHQHIKALAQEWAERPG